MHRIEFISNGRRIEIPSFNCRAFATPEKYVRYRYDSVFVFSYELDCFSGFSVGRLELVVGNCYGMMRL